MPVLALVLEPAYRLVEVAILSFLVPLLPVSVSAFVAFFLVEDVFVASASVGISVSVDIGLYIRRDLYIDAVVAVVVFVPVTALAVVTVATVACIFEVALVIVFAVVISLTVCEFDLEYEVVVDDVCFRRHLGVDGDAERMIDVNLTTDKVEAVPPPWVAAHVVVVVRQEERWRTHHCLVEWSSL